MAVKMLLFAASGALFGCPLSMTDGAAHLIQQLEASGASIPQHVKDLKVVEHIKSDNKEGSLPFWTSGQWMTEKKGGSDVGNGTETISIDCGDHCKLYGYKWFTSAIDSDMTILLARDTDANFKSKAGGNGLSLYFLKIRDDKGKLNNIEVVRMKDKLGTR
jgi:alkylation response protein AidB-like acyl-CoA dehydrogenase